MKKKFAGLFIAVLCIAFIVLAYAEEESAPCYTPVLMDWAQKTEKIWNKRFWSIGEQMHRAGRPGYIRLKSVP